VSDWIEGCGEELPRGALAWVDHPKHGVVWAEKDFYTDEDEDRVETVMWTWCAYGCQTGDAFPLAEVTRYWLIEKPETPSRWVTRQELVTHLRKIGDAHNFGDVSGAARWLANLLEGK
jgi:hypothetical protein